MLDALRRSKGLLTAREAAALLVCSPRSFRRLIQLTFGENFRSLRLRVKLECAQKALLETQEPISAISKQLGYKSRGKFDRSFERAFGLSPAQYRVRHNPTKTHGHENWPLRGIDKIENIGYRARRVQK